ncbi:MAG: STAS domain-containing protein [Vicinamibacterales bacterium]
MQINTRTFGDLTVLDLSGKLTIDDGAAVLRDRVASLVSQGQRKLLLNLAQVPYVDSGGLGELVRCSLIANREKGAVKLVNLTQRIADLLTITKLLTVFDTFDNEDAARASFT